MLIDRAPLVTRPQSAPRPNVGLFLVAALACAAAVFAVYWAFVRTATGQFIDENALQQAELGGASTRGQLFEFLDQLPVISLVVAATLVLILAAVRRAWGSALVAVGAMGAANLSTQVLKNLVFDRPDLGLETLSFNSLPSGHTTIAASALGAVFLMSAPRWRPFAAFAGALFAVVAGAATFVNMWHRPADIVAALFVVAAWVFVGGAVVQFVERGRIRAGVRAGHVWTWLSAGVGGAALLATILLFSLDAKASQSSNEVQPWLSSTFLGGIAFIIAAGFLIAAVASWIFYRAGSRPGIRAGSRAASSR